MEIIKSFILGVVQGLTEFLPVSSSGHIEIFKELLGFSFESQNGLFFTLILHLATAFSALIYFWDDVKNILKSTIKFKNDENFHFTLMIIVSMIPAGLVGFFLEEKINQLFNGNLLLGLAQALAILPGISRSGSTIATSIFIGINRDLAAKFSFLMVIPIIVGSSLKMILFDDIVYDGSILINYIIGFFAALISGYYACKWMIFFVRKSKLKYFALYCFIVGISSILYSIL